MENRRRPPKGCVVPKVNRQRYVLTVRDIQTMEKLLRNVFDIISFYSNMPENKTGELAVNPRNHLIFDGLQHLAEDVCVALDDVEYRD